MNFPNVKSMELTPNSHYNKRHNGLPLNRSAEGGIGWSGGLARSLLARAIQPVSEFSNLRM